MLPPFGLAALKTEKFFQVPDLNSFSCNPSLFLPPHPHPHPQISTKTTTVADEIAKPQLLHRPEISPTEQAFLSPLVLPPPSTSPLSPYPELA